VQSEPSGSHPLFLSLLSLYLLFLPFFTPPSASEIRHRVEGERERERETERNTM